MELLNSSLEHTIPPAAIHPQPSLLDQLQLADKIHLSIQNQHLIPAQTHHISPSQCTDPKADSTQPTSLSCHSLPISQTTNFISVHNRPTKSFKNPTSKFYRHPDPRLGFQINRCGPIQTIFGYQSISQLIRFINQQFQACSKAQTDALLAIPSDQTLVTRTLVLLLLPLGLLTLTTISPTAISMLSLVRKFVEHIEIVFIFIFSVLLANLFCHFRKIDKLRDDFLQSEKKLEKKFLQIRKDFNRRFPGMIMEHYRAFSVDQEDYLQITIYDFHQLKFLNSKTQNSQNPLQLSQKKFENSTQSTILPQSTA